MLSGLVFFAWGEIYSLFPATCGDTYGGVATTNAGMLYTAKGTAALLVPFAERARRSRGGWQTVFVVAAAMNFGRRVLALLALKPLRQRRWPRS